MLNLSPVMVAVITGPIVPFLVGLLTKSSASSKVKTIVNTVTSLVVSAVATAVIPETGVAVLSWDSVATFVVTALVSASSYDSFWKPVFAIDEKLAPNRGFGQAS